MFAIPLAWLQLKREKIRLLVALAGIGFAVILMFLQLGFQDALFDSAVTLHQNIEGDIFLVSPQSTSLIAMKSFPERRLYQSLGFAGVKSISPIYIGFGIWKNPYWQGLPTPQTRSILVLGTNPGDTLFSVPGVEENRSKIRLTDVVLFDSASRPEFGPIPEKLQALSPSDPPIRTEVESRQIEIGGLFRLGASFGADGNLMTSDLTFHRIFPSRDPRQIDIGVIKLEPGADLYASLERFKNLPGERRIDPKKQDNREDFVIGDVRVMSKAAFIAFEMNYWKDSTAIGFIFTLGTAIGFIVGTVIVYQILYTDVADHLAEYATLKAMGYKNRYLLSVVFQEAIILSVMGYIPGYVLCIGLYHLTRNATSLPLAMTLSRGIFVLCLTILMCVISGTIAVRKVQQADPADIF
ncbi:MULTISPECIES: ABC transporter permease DevC [Leptolyngbya]|uniref:ABC transporter permease DevC n=1 Tax=Leptolyngbya TaxID=47251 RepID=UPI00168A088F|nr:ABC transporter permease DevC [Leptolyngbya sp. FACHB-1624]MBD1854930.1 FtsX-like permease family protein [Leptolyngbya sp. FACHB-1624]